MSSLTPEHHINPAQNQIAVEEIEPALFRRGRFAASDDRSDDDIATVVECKRHHRLRRWDADRIAAATAFHRVHLNGPAGTACRNFASYEVDIADAIEFLVVGHSGLTIAEADFRPQVDIDLNPAIGR